LRTLPVALIVASIPSAAMPLLAQSPPKPEPIIPLKVEIVVSRYQGEKKVSSLPYTLTVNANDKYDGELVTARLRTGATVPVPSFQPPKESPVQGAMGPVVYKQIGINIDCTARTTDDGRYKVAISIEDTSVYSDGQTAQGVPKLSDIPSFRTFQSSNMVILKDGESSQFTAATDRITGEVTKVDVTMRVVK
jgi:hypothetical protein